jgi:hypothetical protein
MTGKKRGGHRYIICFCDGTNMALGHLLAKQAKNKAKREDKKTPVQVLVRITKKGGIPTSFR